MRRFLIVAAALTLASFAASYALAQNGPPVAAITLDPAKGDAKLAVTSTAFGQKGVIANTFTQFGSNQSPPLSWTAGPLGTQSYAVLCEDMGGKRREPIIHWVLYDQPTSRTLLGQNVPNGPATPDGASQGLNSRKDLGYMGPRPPAGQTHPYHFEVFALDTMLKLDPGKTDRNALVAAMKGHVLASGELVGLATGQ